MLRCARNKRPPLPLGCRPWPTCSIASRRPATSRRSGSGTCGLRSRAFARLIGEEPGRIELDLGQLRNRLAAINPVSAGSQREELRQYPLRSFCSDQGERTEADQQDKPTLGGALARPHGKAHSKASAYWAVSRLARYGSARGLAPDDVNDAVIADFMESVREGSLHRKPNDLHRKTTVIWNEIASAFPELGLCACEHPFVPPPCPACRLVATSRELPRRRGGVSRLVRKHGPVCRRRPFASACPRTRQPPTRPHPLGRHCV